MAINNILLMPNLTREHTAALLPPIIERLTSCGCVPLMDAVHAGKFDGAQYDRFETQIAACDLIVTIGGDGTILHGAQHAIAHDKPLLGINTGRLGYLAQVEADELALLERLPQGDYLTQHRMLLQLEIEGMKKCYALNDVVITNDIARLVDLEVSENGNPVGVYRADGLIFATPTGSTAYSLSAGGPIIHPEIDSILLTPVCPHSLYARPLLLQPQMLLQVTNRRINSAGHIVVSADGNRVATPEDHAIIHIRRADKTLQFISFREKAFGNLLSHKLGINSGEKML